MVAQFLFRILGRTFKFRTSHALRCVHHQQCRSRHGIGEMRIQTTLVNIVEAGGQLVELGLLQGIEFVVVAPRAFQCQPQHRRAKRDDSVGHILRTKFLFDTSPFVRLPMIAVEGCRQDLLLCRSGQEVSGQLPGDELIVRKVLVERSHDPISPGPHRAIDVRLISVGIRIAGYVEPIHGHAFTILRQRQQSVHQSLVGIFACVRQKRVDLLERGWQARQIKPQSPQQPFLRSRWTRLKSFRLHPRPDKPVDRILRPGRDLHIRQGRRGNRSERPMLLPLGPLFDPATQHVDFVVVERQFGIDRWHPLRLVTRRDALPQEAVLQIMWLNDRLIRIGLSKHAVPRVQPQIGLSMRGIRTMTGKAAISQNRPHILSELDCLRLRARRILSPRGAIPENTGPENATQRQRDRHTEKSVHGSTPLFDGKPTCWDEPHPQKDAPVLL